MWLTTEELAARWKMSEQRLRTWRMQKIGPPYCKIGDGKKSPVRYHLPDVEEFEKRMIERK